MKSEFAVVGAPFSIVSGGSFSLNPGQPQEIVVRFAPGAAGGYNANLQISSNGGSQTVSLSGTSSDFHFLGELQDTQTLRMGILDSIDAFRTGFFFESPSSSPVYLWQQVDRSRQEVLTTLESRQGERLQGRVRILQAPRGEINCPTLLLSDFEDQQKVLAAYHCLFDAGLRIEIQLQFKDYSVTLPPTRLTSASDYAAAEEALRQIASRASSAFREAVRSSVVSIDDATVQAFAHCLQNNLIQQPSAAHMIPLMNCNRARSCWGCIFGILGAGKGWHGFLAAAFTPGLGTAVAIGAIAGLAIGTLGGVGGAAMTCPECIGGCGVYGPPPPPRSGGGGCSQCRRV